MRLKTGLINVVFLFCFSILSYGRIETRTTCYQICINDNFGNSGCMVKCESYIIIIENGSTENENNGNSDNSQGGNGNEDNIIQLFFDQDKNGYIDCWKKLTESSRITCDFGKKRVHGCKFHTGVDIGTAQEGGKINLRSATSGVVSEIGFQKDGAGYYIKILNDDGSITQYSHFDGSDNGTSFNNVGNIAVGDRVFPGQLIGLTDSTGRSTGNHLDIKFYFSGKKNPLDLYNIYWWVSLSNKDVRYCEEKNITYVNPIKILGDESCN